MPKHTVEYWEFEGLRISRQDNSLVFEERSRDCLGVVRWERVGSHPITPADKEHRKSIFIARLCLALLEEYGTFIEWEDSKEKLNVEQVL